MSAEIQPATAAPTLLSVRDLHVTYPTDAGPLAAVRGVDLELGAGETLGLGGRVGLRQVDARHARCCGCCPAGRR